MKPMKQEKIVAVAADMLAKEGARRVILFGSYARGTQRKGSDLDLLVEFRRTKSLFEMVRIEDRLREALGVDVDLVTKASLSPYISRQVLKEGRVIYS